MADQPLRRQHALRVFNSAFTAGSVLTHVASVGLAVLMYNSQIRKETIPALTRRIHGIGLRATAGADTRTSKME
jgi:hypothetical protein